MAFSISPGVTVSEVDLTTVVPSVLTTAGAFAGRFAWGPANKRITVSSESDLNKRFGNPDNNNYTSYFTAASFLAYGNNLKVVRAVGATTYTAECGSGTNLQITNSDSFEATYLNSDNADLYGAFAARYPGALGNSLYVSVADSASYSTWTYKGYFAGAPGTSAAGAATGATNDELHVIVIDAGGLFTGVKNTVLEVFQFLSKGSDAKDSLGNSNYYKNYIFNNSKYVYAMGPVSYATTNATWGLPLAATTYVTIASAVSLQLANGADSTPSAANFQTAFNLFANGDEVDVSLIITGDAAVTVQQTAIDISASRKDCITFVSPPSANVVNQSGNEVTNITAWNTALGRTTSYAVADCGWKYMFDKYNNVYRWVPLNGDIAGLCVYTDSVRDPWYSPAGYNRGNLKNVVKLAWNPNKTDRDSLYTLGINPVATFPGQGTVLFGDKTLLNKPSAFDRINVRRLFIVLEKAIAQASKFSMFEFNDEFTRAQFVALVTPFLRDIQGRRGIYDFRVVCDTTNNTSQVIDSNQFVGDIYVKPARAINFIQLNFVAVRTGVDFTEVVGKF
jgi:phage tail sheath protein FI